MTRAYAALFLLLLFSESLAAQCPTTTHPHWAKGAVVYFSLGNIDPNSSEGKQIVAASVAWNNANVNNTTSGVLYYQANAQNPAVWTFNNGTTSTNVVASTSWNAANGIVTSATTTIGVSTLYSSGNPIFSSTQPGYSTAFQKDAEHEFAHLLGLDDVNSGQVAGDTVMNQFSGTNDSGNNVAVDVVNDPCHDVNLVNSAYTSGGGGSGGGGGTCTPPPNCSYWDSLTCTCQTTCVPPTGGCGPYDAWIPYPTCACEYEGSPIIIDTTGKGFQLTSAEDGVRFDIRGTGRRVQLAWTSADSGDALLALDRNGNGIIDSGKELFGNFTEQPPSDDQNGYLALAEFDKPENGGNADGIIDFRDAVFPRLLLWIDTNHDGVSQLSELHTLPELGVYSISLNYRDERYSDQYGNWFHYRAALNPSPLDGQSKDGRWTYDVFFVIESGGANVGPSLETLDRTIWRVDHTLK